MPVLRQRGDGDVGDVLDVDERLAHVAERQRQRALDDALEEEALAEVLGEPAAADDRGRRVERLHGLLGLLRLGLAAAREQHEPADALRPAAISRERGDRLGRAGDGEVGVVGQVGRGRPAGGGGPGGAVVPVEPRRARAGAERARRGRAGGGGRRRGCRSCRWRRGSGWCRARWSSCPAVNRDDVRLSMAVRRRSIRERLQWRPWTPSPDCSTARGRGARSCCARASIRRGRCASRTRRR